MTLPCLGTLHDVNIQPVTWLGCGFCRYFSTRFISSSFFLFFFFSFFFFLSSFFIPSPPHPLPPPLLLSFRLSSPFVLNSSIQAQFFLKKFYTNDGFSGSKSLGLCVCVVGGWRVCFCFIFSVLWSHCQSSKDHVSHITCVLLHVCVAPVNLASTTTLYPCSHVLFWSVIYIHQCVKLKVSLSQVTSPSMPAWTDSWSVLWNPRQKTTSSWSLYWEPVTKDHQFMVSVQWNLWWKTTYSWSLYRETYDEGPSVHGLWLVELVMKHHQIHGLCTVEHVMTDHQFMVSAQCNVIKDHT